MPTLDTCEIAAPAAATYEKCAHCHLFIEENEAHGDPVIAEYVHLHRGDTADEALDASHEARPSGQIKTLDDWERTGPPEMIARFNTVAPDPTRSLTMPITDASALNDIAAAREIAESALADAKVAADQLRVHHARVALRDAFPEYPLAVFVRYANEDDGVRLAQLLSNDGVLEVNEPDQTRDLTKTQKCALNIADRAINLIGDDHSVYAHLEASDEEHDDWYEFQLALRPDIAVEAGAAASVPESL